jgi:hypothetical protein
LVLPEDVYKARDIILAVENHGVPWHFRYDIIEYLTTNKRRRKLQLRRRFAQSRDAKKSFVLTSFSSTIYLSGNLLCNSPRHFAKMVERYYQKELL